MYFAEMRSTRQSHLLQCLPLAIGLFVVLGSSALGPGVGLTPVLAQASSQSDRVPSGWFMAGSKPASYRTGIDTAVTRDGQSSAYLASLGRETGGFGTLMQSINATNYAGKRVRLSASIKSRNLSDWAGLWMRVDRDKTMLAFDNMQSRAIKWTADWTACEVVLDVPEDATGISFGFLLSGAGQVWVNGLNFEVVGKKVAVTAANPSRQSLPAIPVNLNFSK